MPSPRGATGRWRSEKIGKRWVLVTPAGNAFWMIGIWGVTGDAHADERGVNYDQRTVAKYGSVPAAHLQANRRLKSWGFNSVGPWSYRMILPIDDEPEWGGTQPVKFPYTLRGLNSSEPGREYGLFKNLYARIDKDVARTNYCGGQLPDVFDPAWVSNTHRQYATDNDLIAQSKSPYFLALFPTIPTICRASAQALNSLATRREDSRASGLHRARDGAFAGDKSLFFAPRSTLRGHQGLYEVCASRLFQGKIRNHRGAECGLAFQLYDLRQRRRLAKRKWIAGRERQKNSQMVGNSRPGVAGRCGSRPESGEGPG